MSSKLSTIAKEYRDAHARKSAMLKLVNAAGGGKAIDLIAKVLGENAALFVSLDTTSVDVSFSGNKEALGAVWHILRTAGFEAPLSRPESGQSYYSGTFTHENGARIYLGFSSTVCKQVKVGTRMVEQPIYEVQCTE